MDLLDGMDRMDPIDPKDRTDESVVGQAREDVEPWTTHGVAPESRADRVPPDVEPGPSRSAEPPGDRPDRRLERGPAVPGIGGGKAPPEELGETPAVHLKPPLATKARTPEVGKRPVSASEASKEPEK